VTAFFIRGITGDARAVERASGELRRQTELTKVVAQAHAGS
jgi:hypothetical protein